MKPLKIILIITLAAGCVMIAALAVFSRMYLNPQTVETSLRFEAARQLKREVSFERLTVGFFKGICLEGVTVHKSRRESSDLLTCKKIDLKFSYLPLLLKKLMIREITIQEPELNLAWVKGRSISLVGTRRPTLKNGLRLGLLIIPRSFQLQNGAIRLLDSRSVPLLSLHSVQATADTISLISAFPFSAQAQLQGKNPSTIQCTGKASLPKKNISADVTLEGLSVEYVKSLLQNTELPLQEGSVALKSTIQAEYGKPLRIDGTLELKDLSVAASPSPWVAEEIALSNADATLAFQSEWNNLKQELRIKDIQGEVLSSACTGSGLIKKRGRKMLVSGSLVSERFSLDSLFKHLEFGPKTPVKDLGLSGFANVRASLTSSTSGIPTPVLRVTLGRNRITFPGLGGLQPALQGRFEMNPDKITIMNLRVGTQELSVTLAGNLSDYRRWPPKSSLKILSSRIDFQALFAPNEQAPSEPLGPFDFGTLRFSGPVNLGATTFMGVRLKDVRGTYLFENNKFYIKNLNGRIGQGSFSLDGTVDLGVKGLDYYSSLSIQSVPMKSVMVMFPGNPYRNFLKGNLTGTCTLQGRGGTPEPFFKSLVGDAVVDINDASFQGFKLMPELASVIKVPKLKQIKFNQAHLEFMLRSGTVYVDGNLNSPELELHPSGELQLDASLDLGARLKLSQSLLGQSTYLARYLPREGDWVSLPLTIKGTLQDPQVSISEETMQFIFKESLPRLLMDILSEKADADNGSLAGVIESLTGAEDGAETESVEEDAEAALETEPEEAEILIPAEEDEYDPAEIDAPEDAEDNATAEELIEIEE